MAMLNFNQLLEKVNLEKVEEIKLTLLRGFLKTTVAHTPI